jgi:uncharacterized protein YjbI with pentapeptide repeats
MIDSVNKCLAKGTIVSPFPSLENGRVDLRGMLLKSFVKRVRFEAVDFSYMHSDWTGRFDWCRFRNCSFRMAELTGRFGTDTAQCDFAQAVFDNDGTVVLGGRFVDCCLDGADMTTVSGDQVEFVRCTFRMSQMLAAQLIHSKFDHCDFANIVLGSGSLAYSRFIGCRIASALRGQTLMEGVVEEDGK